MATVEREDSDDDEGLSSDPDSIDDDALRSVDAFSSTDEDEDRAGVFYLAGTTADVRTVKVSSDSFMGGQHNTLGAS